MVFEAKQGCHLMSLDLHFGEYFYRIQSPLHLKELGKLSSLQELVMNLDFKNPIEPQRDPHRVA